MAQWKLDRGLADDAVLNSWQKSKVLEETEVAFYMKKPQCVHTAGNYQGSVDGWINSELNFSISPEWNIDSLEKTN